MLTTHRSRVGATLLTLAALLLVVSPAHGLAGDNEEQERTPSDTDVTPDSSGGDVSVSIELTGSTAGNETFTVTHRASVVRKCWYTRWWTGDRYFTWWDSGDAGEIQEQMPLQYRTTPFPGWRDHEGDTEGYWYTPSCGKAAEFDYLREWLANNPPVYWTPGETVPSSVTVDPRELADAAYDFTVLPTGTIEWSPKVGDAGATVINMPTWVWVTEAPTTVVATARTDSGAWARVEAVLDSMTLTAEGADPATCQGAGAADSDECAITFHRSTAHLPVKSGQTSPTTTLSATATWTASWTSFATPDPADLPSQDITATTEIPVGEIQTIVGNG